MFKVKQDSTGDDILLTSQGVSKLALKQEGVHIEGNGVRIAPSSFLYRSFIWGRKVV